MVAPTPLEVGTWRMLTKRAPLLDRDAVAAEALAQVHARAPRLVALAERELERLPPDRWTIEWHLPGWLGQRFGLDAGFVAALSRSNVLGLLAVRLEDDLEDGDVAMAEIADTEMLARVAFDAAVAGYREWFDAASSVWSFIDHAVAQRRAGGSGPDLALRGAPLKIAGFACCLRADRLELWPALEASLDGAVTALVLYDQFFDWEADLSAGRWNAFVASVVGGRQRPASRERIRAAVLTSMLTGRAASEHLDAAIREATQASDLAGGIGIAGLADFLEAWAAQTSEQAATVAAHYHDAGDRATRLLLGTRVGGAAT